MRCYAGSRTRSASEIASACYARGSTDDSAENAELVRRIASRAAETELCRRFASRAQLYGRRHLRDPDGARDLAQAAMLAVLEAARACRIADAPRLDRFVLGTCRNIAARMRDVDARAEPTTRPSSMSSSRCPFSTRPTWARCSGA